MKWLDIKYGPMESFYLYGNELSGSLDAKYSSTVLFKECPMAEIQLLTWIVIRLAS
jgi:hypothetical protein